MGLITCQGYYCSGVGLRTCSEIYPKIGKGRERERGRERGEREREGGR